MSVPSFTADAHGSIKRTVRCDQPNPEVSMFLVERDQRKVGMLYEAL